MLYDEFIKGTGCKERPCNYEVFKRLEIIYMNDDTMTKEDVYEWGKKLVDNDLTDEQKAWNRRANEQIDAYKERIVEGKRDLQRYKANLEWAKTQYWGEDLKEELKFWKRAIADENNTLKTLRNRIRALKESLYV